MNVCTGRRLDACQVIALTKIVLRSGRQNMLLPTDVTGSFCLRYAPLSVGCLLMHGGAKCTIGLLQLEGKARQNAQLTDWAVPSAARRSQTVTYSTPSAKRSDAQRCM